MKASDIMSTPVYVVSPQENISHARNLMLRHRISRLLVTNGEELVGIITRKDIAYGLRQSEPLWRRRPIDRIPVEVMMTRSPIVVSPTTFTEEIASMMVNNRISGLPVVEGGRVAGIVTKSDLLRSTLVQNLPLRAHDLMEEAITVSRYHSLSHIIDQMRERNNKLVVMNNDGTIAGIISESNIVFFDYEAAETGVPVRDVKLLRKDETAGRKRYRYVMNVSAIAEDVMTRPVVTTGPDAPLKEVVDLMNKHRISTVVVVEGQELKGIVKRDSIIREVAK
ncbi:MAG: CBS domain-containing protein [Methanomicrobiales archaeon]|nr:CBS domain-containing protein [Methanomicrobiales archaeon]